MAYTKTNWTARAGTNLNKFAASGAVSGSIFLTNTPDAITQAGTPFSVENMNKIEEGIFSVHEAIDDLLAQAPFGYMIPFEFEPTALELALWRCLPLSGQMALISQYQRLCDRKYVGNAANATADWWYKASDDQGLNRDVNGAYMRVLDRRGLLGRAAGQNSKYKMANDAPFDGKEIGAYIEDAMQEINALVGMVAQDMQGYPPTPPFLASASIEMTISPGQGIGAKYTKMILSTAVRTAEENRPASISSYLCIRY